MDAPAADTRTSRFAVLPLLVLLRALLYGSLLGIGGALIALATSPTDGFEVFARMIGVGLVVALAVGAVVWVVGLTRLARRLFVPGGRMLPVGLALVVAAVGVLLQVVTAPTLYEDPSAVIAQAAALLGQLVILAAGSVGFWVAGARLRPRTAAA